MFHEIRMGIPEPETAAGINAVADINGMRQAILKGQWESALIKQCMVQAMHAGLSGEDTYVLLAYHALIALEKSHQQNMKWIMLDPRASLGKSDDR